MHAGSSRLSGKIAVVTGATPGLRKAIARACLYLASDESGLMTGANIDFDQTIVGIDADPLQPEQMP